MKRGAPDEIVSAYTEFVDSGNSAEVLEDF
jgi:hypothetical protein